MTGPVRPEEAGSERAPDLGDAHIARFYRDSNGKPQDTADIHIEGGSAGVIPGLLIIRLADALRIGRCRGASDAKASAFREPCTCRDGVVYLVGFQNSASGLELVFYAARSYSTGRCSSSWPG
jgi:hypothetical protein